MVVWWDGGLQHDGKKKSDRMGGRIYFFDNSFFSVVRGFEGFVTLKIVGKTQTYTEFVLGIW